MFFKIATVAKFKKDKKKLNKKKQTKKRGKNTTKNGFIFIFQKIWIYCLF